MSYLYVKWNSFVAKTCDAEAARLGRSGGSGQGRIIG
jgi:hypothetical protein